ncbi:MAG: hypothetical protein CVT59_03735 [Actinobacteria bacterium HGW-Actinobacteria-1]|jgi:pyruvate,water dikinase|nr:MAG: hypothetical protein CVT59_03735 [Actinobacteria bacterium HGW-Actinobacteria-1]
MGELGAREIGPKAESLRRLSAAALPVPEARFLGCEAYREHVARADIAKLLAEASGAPLDPATIADVIVGTPVDPAVVSQLSAWHAELGGVPVSVRSSANAEDLPGASFAGQHGTYFVSDPAALAARVRDCWASLYSERAVRYRERNGIDHAGVEMAVIVQRLIPAISAGVAFTVDPVTGSDDITVEACVGLGEALVSGKVTPDRFTFAHDGLGMRGRALARKSTRVIANPDGGLTEMPVPPGLADAPAITDEVAHEVAVLAMRAEKLFGVPIDVEWAYDGERVWLLQARPITTLKSAAAAPIVWSNVNTGEILPDVITPLTWSVIHGHADEIFGGMFGSLGVRIDAQKLIGRVGGRVYFNLSLLRDSFATLPIDVDRILGGMQEYVEMPDLPAVPRRRGASAGLRAAMSLPPYILKHRAAGAKRFSALLRADTDAAIAQVDAGLSAEEAHALFERLVDMFAAFAEGLAYMSVAMLGFGSLTMICNRWLGDESGALANSLVAGRGDVASAEAGIALWRLAASARKDDAVREAVLGDRSWVETREALEAAGATRFLGEWDAFMAEHGHHRRGELEFFNPTWAEQPEYVLGMVRGYLAHAEAEDPLVTFAARARAADETAERCRRELKNPLKRAIFERMLAWGRTSAGARENIKSEAVRWLAAIRRTLLVLGERLVERGALSDRDDVFFLAADELGRLVAGDASTEWRSLVARRRAEHTYLETLSPPSIVVGEWDEHTDGMRIPDGVDVLKGISVSAGVARGPARVFLSADTEEHVLPGEILVAPFTDPGWTPYFIPAAGIVMDMGGMLSHGSIIAREYGIPAVVNVGPATRIISTGDLIEVDGDRGEVRLLGQHPEREQGA